MAPGGRHAVGKTAELVMTLPPLAGLVATIALLRKQPRQGWDSPDMTKHLPAIGALWRVIPGDLGTFLGLRADKHARVLDDTQSPIKGLYAVGNDMASFMGGNYPGAGITIGPAMTFGYIAARHIAGVESND